MIALSTFKCWATDAGGVCVSQLDRETSWQRGALDRVFQFLERLLCHRADHVRKGDVVLGRTGKPEAIERAAEISKFVGRKFPVSVLPRLPEPLLNG
jgi:hypothetical protein